MIPIMEHIMQVILIIIFITIIYIMEHIIFILPIIPISYDLHRILIWF